MTTITIRIPGAPIGKGRARSFIRPGFGGKPSIGHFTPQKTRTWEGVAKSLAMDAMGVRPPFAGPVRVDIEIVLAIPESWPGWKRELALRGELMPTVKPDSDNVEKAVKDALNGVAWLDDCQVVLDSKRKRYGATPYVEAQVTVIHANAAQIKKRGDVLRAA